MTRPLRILYLIDEIWGLAGAERSLLRILRLLPRDRFQPSLLTFRVNPELEDTLRALPCPLYVYPLRRIYTWRGFRLAQKFRQLLESENIDIVHTFFESSDLWGGLTARLSRNVVIISSRRDLGIQRNAFHNLAYRFAGRLFDQVQAVSDEVRDYVIRADRLDPARVITVPNGVELDRVAPASDPAALRLRFGLGSARPLITSVGHIRPVKGYDVLIRTAEIVCRHLPEARFLVAGQALEPRYFQQLQEEIARQGLSAAIRFLGPVEDVFGLLAVSEAFFLPSRSEGMSNALLEAMASSLPSVATRVGGNSQLVQDGETGFLTPVEDAEAAAARLLDLLQNPERAREMGRAARRLVETRYSMETVIRQLAAEYKKLAAARGLLALAAAAKA